VEQLHKIFKLCGSPSRGLLRKSKLPHATIFKPQQPYSDVCADTFKESPRVCFGAHGDAALLIPRSWNRRFRLKSEFFRTKPLACDPSSLPRYPPSKEFDAKVRDEEARRYI
ncbi:hypothetical protein IFM89_011245, partial [Coptis chinensis]